MKAIVAPITAAIVTLIAGACLAPLATAGLAAAKSARASLPVVERQVMCVTCKIPLDEAQSPQADRERAFVRMLIAEGRDETQIKKALVTQYGPAVLGLPSAHGFDVVVYAVPVAVVLALVALLAALLPAWRRRTRAHGARSQPPQLSPDDAARLDADIARFD